MIVQGFNLRLVKSVTAFALDFIRYLNHGKMQPDSKY